MVATINFNHLFVSHNSINTSFNIRGEPIVNTEEDARNSALRMGVGYLVLNGRNVIL